MIWSEQERSVPDSLFTLSGLDRIERRASASSTETYDVFSVLLRPTSAPFFGFSGQADFITANRFWILVVFLKTLESSLLKIETEMYCFVNILFCFAPPLIPCRTLCLDSVYGSQKSNSNRSEYLWVGHFAGRSRWVLQLVLFCCGDWGCLATVAMETRGREDGVPAEKKRERTQGERKQLWDYAQAYYTHLDVP